MCGGWQVRRTGDGWQLASASKHAVGDGLDDLNALRALCAAVWAGDGKAKNAATTGGPVPGDDAAAAALERLGLTRGR